MSRWNGFAPASPLASLAQWAQDLSPTTTAGTTTNPWVDSDTGEPVVWWQEPNLGVQFEPVDCNPVHCAPVRACDDPLCVDCDDPAANPDPIAGCIPAPCDLADFQPFYVFKGATACNLTDPLLVRRWQRLKAELAAQQHVVIAKQFTKEIVAISTNLTPVGAPVTSPSEGMGTAMRARATSGLHGGTWVVPFYALPRLIELGLVRLVDGRYIGPGQAPVITDAGIASIGPGGVVAPPGSAWIHYISHPPVWAVHPRMYPVANDSLEELLRVFIGQDKLLSDCVDCPVEMFARQMAIVAFNPCGAFSVPIDLRECSGCEALAVEDAP